MVNEKVENIWFLIYDRFKYFSVCDPRGELSGVINGSVIDCDGDILIKKF